MHPILFKIPLHVLGWPDLPVFSYGFMVMLGFLAAIALTLRLAKREGIHADRIYDLSLLAIMGGVAGARLLWVLLFARSGDLRSWVDYLAVWKGGLVYYGGLLAALALCSAYVRLKNLPWGRTADCFAPGLAVGLALGRIGCFLNGCCFGRIAPADAWCAVRFPEGSLAMQHQLALGAIAAGPSLPVYPTQLMESAAGLVLLAILLLAYRFRRFPGEVTLLFLALYSIARFCLEFFRDDTGLLLSCGGFPGLKAGQITAIVVLVPALTIWLHLRRRARRPGPAD
ncbi:MAG: prolipoprotein diacylglyceryl transferase [Planctomycetota bacterium]